jgi:hypothetical protein
VCLVLLLLLLLLLLSLQWSLLQLCPALSLRPLSHHSWRLHHGLMHVPLCASHQLGQGQLSGQLLQHSQQPAATWESRGQQQGQHCLLLPLPLSLRLLLLLS